MPDTEKVIAGLECCCTHIIGKDCDVCPYEDESWDTDKCVSELAYQALQLLKEQEKIVHCSECVYHATHSCSIEDGKFHPTPNDWFCADGERKEDGEVE